MKRRALAVMFLILAQAVPALAASKSHTIQASCSIAHSVSLPSSFSVDQTAFEDKTNLQESLAFRESHEGRTKLYTFTAL